MRAKHQALPSPCNNLSAGNSMLSPEHARRHGSILTRASLVTLSFPAILLLLCFASEVACLSGLLDKGRPNHSRTVLSTGLCYDEFCRYVAQSRVQADVCTRAGTASLATAALLAGGREAAAGAGKLVPTLGAPAGC